MTQGGRGKQPSAPTIYINPADSHELRQRDQRRLAEMITEELVCCRCGGDRVRIELDQNPVCDRCGLAWLAMEPESKPPTSACPSTLDLPGGRATCTNCFWDKFTMTLRGPECERCGAAWPG